MKKYIPLLAALLVTLSAPAQVRITAHRGFWLSDEAQGAQNSIASLQAAQEIGVWGSEFDVHITSDDVLIVNHDDDIQGVRIWENPYSVLAEKTLSNGEHPSTLDAMLDQAMLDPAMVLVFEVKWQATRDRERLLVDKALEALRVRGLLDPSRVIFISFCYPACKYLVEKAPGFMVQYLWGDKTPDELYADGIMGLDFHYSSFYEHPEWVERAHALGMQVNVWTVDKEEDIQAMIDLGVDCITTNYPLRVRERLGDREIRAGICEGNGCCDGR